MDTWVMCGICVRLRVNDVFAYELIKRWLVTSGWVLSRGLSTLWYPRMLSRATWYRNAIGKWSGTAQFEPFISLFACSWNENLKISTTVPTTVTNVYFGARRQIKILDSITVLWITSSYHSLGKSFKNLFHSAIQFRFLKRPIRPAFSLDFMLYLGHRTWSPPDV